ncbi:MAG TPA: heavy metal translocating P-type ATPase [Gemmatimonadaceae bacterium]|nr:heavy metal translocating P-type ATPase [Gemmatimonadaceae bacterium]
MPDKPRRLWLVIPTLTLLILAVGGAIALFGDPVTARRILFAGLVATGVPLIVRTAAGALRGRFAADIVAALAVATAIALQQPIAGLVVVLMQTGGEALERYAEGRASRALRMLEDAAPRIAHRVRDGLTEDVTVDAIAVGDELLVRPGETVPCDGVVVDGHSHVDASAITGEPVPLSAIAGVELLSGSFNQEGAIHIRATARAGESQYARIVEMVRTAQASKAPLQRLADRYAVWFTPLTLAVCVIAYLLTQDATRILSVLVVATPCPLILATPVAIIGGINRAARSRIIVRHGGALEQLAGVTAAVFDKTGTLTIGRPEVSDVVPVDGTDRDSVLALAAAVEERSGHLLARSVVAAARARGLPIAGAEGIVETPGRGVIGTVGGREVAVGSRAYLQHRYPALRGVWRLPPSPVLSAHVAIDGAHSGVIEFADRVRSAARETIADLRREGVQRVILLSGDDTPTTRAVATAVGIDDARGDLLPQDKAAAVRELTSSGAQVVMVGDGTNDAPALSAATVGIAMARHGGITAEAADAVLLSDDIADVARAIHISKRTMRIARQSIVAGLGASAVAMVFAALGMIPPTMGALLQEGIDVAVILNALRASR